jgi:hypothetical protein
MSTAATARWYRCMDAYTVLLPEKLDRLDGGFTSGKGCEIYENTKPGRVVPQHEILAHGKRGF